LDTAVSHSERPSHPLSWFPEFLELTRKRSWSQGRILGSAVLVGVVAGLGAVLFSIACQFVIRWTLDEVAGYRARGPVGEAWVAWIPESTQAFRPWLLPVTALIGGLTSGFLVFRFAPEAEGHGTDSVIFAYHNRQGKIRSRVPIVKLFASAITIGTGGSGGREGPIAQIGAGFGSVLARLLRLSPVERRILMAAGMGAGIAAIFRAPLAGALFASEVLYSSPEFEPEVILPAGLASVVSYSTFGLFFGWGPLFVTPMLEFTDVAQLAAYLVLAVAMALLAMVYTRSFYWFTYLFTRLPLPRALKPAIGAALSGLVGVGVYYSFGENQQVLSVLSFGYGILQEGFTDTSRLSVAVLAAVALGKILTTSLTIGSGGSGGVFGPSMVIGGCGGGAFGLLLQRFWPHLAPQPASFMIVGMAGFFAAAAKTPFSTLVIVCELTGHYGLIVPALWVCTLAYLLSDEQSLYRSQVKGRYHSPAHRGGFVREVLAGQTVAQVLTEASKVAALHPDDPLPVVLDRFDTTSRLVLPVTDPRGRVLGVVHLNEAYWTSHRVAEFPWLLAVDMMRTEVKPLTPDTSLERAVELFAEADLSELPVVKDTESRELLAMMKRSDVAKAYLRRVHAQTAASPAVTSTLVPRIPE
jgi:CIC family chloride channel protein